MMLDLRAVFADTLRLGAAAFTFVLPVAIVDSLATNAWRLFGPGTASETGVVLAVDHGLRAVLSVLATLIVMPGLLDRLDRPGASMAWRLDSLRMVAPLLVASVLRSLPYWVFEGRFIERPRPLIVSLALLLIAVLTTWLQARLFIVVPVAVRERGSVRATLRRSWQLTRGAALHIVLAQLALVVPGFFVWLLGHTLQSHGWPHGNEWASIAVFVMLWPFDLALQAVIHRDLLRREAGASSVLPATAPA